MSSSNVFKHDSTFVPIRLIQYEVERLEELAAGSHESDSAAESMLDDVSIPGNDTNPPSPPSPAAAAPQAPRAKEPEIDLQALQEEAYNEGVQDTIIKQQSEIQRAVAAFTEACSRLNELNNRLQDSSRADMINTVMALTRKLIHRELSTGRDTIAATLQAALDKAIDSREFIVTLHPDDLALAEEAAPDLIARVRSLEHLVFKTDPSLTPGGCHLESEVCAVDATIEGQLLAVEQFLEDQTGDSAPEESAPMERP